MANNNKTKNNSRQVETDACCTFCGDDDIDHLISSGDKYICFNCIDKMHHYIHKDDENYIAETNRSANTTKRRHITPNTKTKSDNDNILDYDANDFVIHKPSEIKAYLDQYVIGQDKAKDIISVAVYNHYKMILDQDETDSTEISKSNILMLGSTGSGKTLLLQTLAKCLDVPLAICDTSKLTAAGYAGADVESSLKILLNEANGDISKAERGIVYFDEFDKISRKGEDVSLSKDVGGEAVQQGLLKLIEGAVVDIPSGNKRSPTEECVKLNTKNILFICGGSFEGIEKIISQRLGMCESGLGFSSTPRKKKEIKLGDVIDQVTTDDLRRFGLIPEMIGRLPIICTLDDLTQEALIKIMVEPKNSLCKQYKKLLKYDNVDLTFNDDALSAIADIAIQRRTGARGLRGIMESLLLKYMKICPEGKIKSINITSDYVNGVSESPEIIYN